MKIRHVASAENRFTKRQESIVIRTSHTLTGVQQPDAPTTTVTGSTGLKKRRPVPIDMVRTTRGYYGLVGTTGDSSGIDWGLEGTPYGESSYEKGGDSHKHYMYLVTHHKCKR